MWTKGTRIVNEDRKGYNSKSDSVRGFRNHTQIYFLDRLIYFWVKDVMLNSRDIYDNGRFEAPTRKRIEILRLTSCYDLK